jgi:cellulose synthase/poly-beta-1,6-N-acetylglucosamine synthase-like glycosyltransferase
LALLSTFIPEEKNYYPRVSCIVTCYSEGKDVALTIRSVTEQIYPGVIEIISVVDGAVQNKETLSAMLVPIFCEVVATLFLTFFSYLSIACAVKKSKQNIIICIISIYYQFR